MSDAEGADNSVAFLNNIKSFAEDKGVTICLELLNSKVNHKDYMCDHTAWGVEVCKRVDSPRVKLLYDIYHMQIMEGDVIRTIRDNIQYIGHFHTGGNPGPPRDRRHAGAELSRRSRRRSPTRSSPGTWRTSSSPLRDPLKSLDEALSMCDV